jgi:hypothetical protein
VQCLVPFTFTDLYPVPSTVDYPLQIEYSLTDTTCGVKGIRATVRAAPLEQHDNCKAARLLVSDKHRVKALVLLASYEFFN